MIKTINSKNAEKQEKYMNTLDIPRLYDENHGTRSYSPGPNDFASTSTAPMLAEMHEIWPTAVEMVSG